MSPPQRTISRDVSLEGVGVHSGETASITFRPSGAGTGIVFRRTDLEGQPEIPADLDHVVDSELGTALGRGSAQVLTVEHGLAALMAVGIDNVLVDVAGPELPIRDGSFADYVKALDDAGAVEQGVDATELTVSRPLHVDGSSGESYVVAPADHLKISASIEFEHPCIGHQYGSFSGVGDVFRREIAPARTFGFASDAADLHARGRALGAALENAVLLDAEGVMNDALRFEDEFLRHKVGDIIGDLALLGARIKAHVVADRPSHSGNVALARALRSHQKRNGAPFADITRIMDFLPHRYPMLLVDRILEYDGGSRVVGLKNVTINEPFFQGHFPGHPVMPGVLIVEAMAQCGGMLLMDEVEDPDTKVVYFMTMDNVKFRRPVTPGDTLIFEIEVLQLRRRVCSLRGEAFVDGVLVAEAEFKATIADR